MVRPSGTRLEKRSGDTKFEIQGKRRNGRKSKTYSHETLNYQFFFI